MLLVFSVYDDEELLSIPEAEVSVSADNSASFNRFKYRFFVLLIIDSRHSVDTPDFVL